MIGLLGFGDSSHKIIAYNTDKVYVRLYRWDSFWGNWFTEIIIAKNTKTLNIYGLQVKVEKVHGEWEIIDVCDD